MSTYRVSATERRLPQRAHQRDDAQHGGRGQPDDNEHAQGGTHVALPVLHGPAPLLGLVGVSTRPGPPLRPGPVGRQMRSSSSSSSAENSLSGRTPPPPRGSPSRSFCTLRSPNETPLFPCELKAEATMLTRT